MGLLNKLLIRYYDMSPLCESSLNSPVDIRKVDINQNWLLANMQIKSQDDSLRKETALVLDSLPYEEISEFMSGNFNKVILRDCIEIAWNRLDDGGCDEEPPLLRAAVDNILKEVERIVQGVHDPNHKVGKMHLQHDTVNIRYETKMWCVKQYKI